MYTIYVHNNESNRLERYRLKPYHNMPYTYSNALSVSAFFANTISVIGWTSTDFLRLWTSFSKGGCIGNYFFRRIAEGGHIQQSMHYAGLAARIPFNYDVPFPFKEKNHVSLFPSGYPTLFPGDIGPFVFILQDALISLGFTNCPLDGFFGTATTRALVSFKNDHALPPTPVFDKKTSHLLTFLAAGSGINNAIKYVRKSI
ncbi:MAG: peptidoglycan-binding protein [Oscillospiraceae bacterium]|nr:peptidoglycan-binding protein [Oscillospiraceae bacterium]